MITRTQDNASTFAPSINVLTKITTPSNKIAGIIDSPPREERRPLAISFADIIAKATTCSIITVVAFKRQSISIHFPLFF